VAGGDPGSPGVVAREAGRVSGCGSGRSSGHIGLGAEEARCSHAVGRNRGAGLGSPVQESVRCSKMGCAGMRCGTDLSLRRVWTMRLAVGVVRLLLSAIWLALRGVTLVVAIALLSWLAVAAAVVISTRHFRWSKRYLRSRKEG
jgi:hypothetical protein